MFRLSILVAVLLAGTAAAQQVLVPANRQDPNSGCLVKGLDPNGDGFLAIRSGPGTNHAQIGSLRNGDAAYIAGGQGRWLYVENGAINGKEARFRGWIYNAWCEFYP